MGLLQPADRTALAQDPEKAGQAMESLMLQRMLASCHLMGKSQDPGSGMRSQLFVEVLADAVTQAGGMGLAKQLNSNNAEGAGDAKQSVSTQANHPTTGPDLETELLSHRGQLIGIGKRTDNSLGEPQNR